MPDYVHVTEPDLVREVLTRTDEFEPTNALTAAVALTPDALRTLARSGFALPPVLASATGELHRTTRRAVTGFFSPARVEAVVPLIRQLARAAAEQVAARPGREVDLGAAVADHLPARVMAEMMGTPLPDRDDLHRWSRDSLELFWGTPSPDRQLHLAGSAAAFHTWLRGVLRASIAADGDDLWATVARTGVSERQVCSLAYFLMIAGQETTSMLTRTVLLRALQDRPTWAGAGADVAAAREVTRQVLAEESSVPTWRRRVGADTTLDGCPLSAGTEVLLEVSGHHRPGDRDGFGLAFGHGLHRCLGAALAETEATHILHETARALPGARWSGAEPAWWRLLSFRTPLTVPALI
ncbi:MAG: cytochrome P450 [Propionibacterium sp.]|nr:cytochrome P450 [Propionibacterium sp.]